MLTKLIVIIISQYIHTSNHHFVYLDSYIQKKGRREGCIRTLNNNEMLKKKLSLTPFNTVTLGEGSCAQSWAVEGRDGDYRINLVENFPLLIRHTQGLSRLDCPLHLACPNL